jgi:hypothetical protein
MQLFSFSKNSDRPFYTCDRHHCAKSAKPGKSNRASPKDSNRKPESAYRKVHRIQKWLYIVIRVLALKVEIRV